MRSTAQEEEDQRELVKFYSTILLNSFYTEIPLLEEIHLTSPRAALNDQITIKKPDIVYHTSSGSLLVGGKTCGSFFPNIHGEALCIRAGIPMPGAGEINSYRNIVPAPSKWYGVIVSPRSPYCGGGKSIPPNDQGAQKNFPAGTFPFYCLSFDLALESSPSAVPVIGKKGVWLKDPRYLIWVKPLPMIYTILDPKNRKSVSEICSDIQAEFSLAEMELEEEQCGLVIDRKNEVACDLRGRPTDCPEVPRWTVQTGKQAGLFG